MAATPVLKRRSIAISKYRDLDVGTNFCEPLAPGILNLAPESHFLLGANNYVTGAKIWLLRAGFYQNLVPKSRFLYFEIPIGLSFESLVEMGNPGILPP